jgi:hypothetical protein
VDVTSLVALGAVVSAIIGAIAVMLRFQREDASAAVKTQSTVLVDMKSLNDELIAALERCRTDRLACELELDELKTRENMLVNRLRALGSNGDA